jgi:hypothetical protein
LICGAVFDIRNPMKRPQSIETLVVFAYDELSKLYSSSAESVWDRVGYGRDRTSGGAQRYDFGAPHPDSEIISKAVDAIPTVAFDWAYTGMLMGEFEALFRAHNVIPEDTVKASMLVRHHGIMKTRPGWGKDFSTRPERIQPARGPSGAAAIEGRCLGKDRYTEGAACPLQWSPSVIDLARSRARYVIWHDSLVRLCVVLGGRLEAFSPTPPECSPSPWLEPGEESIVFRSKSTMTRLPERHPRPVAGSLRKDRVGSGGPVRIIQG